MNVSANLQERRKVLEKPVSLKICEAIGHFWHMSWCICIIASLFPGVCTLNLISLFSPWFPNPLVSSISWNRRHRAEDNAIMNILSCCSFFPLGIQKNPCPLFLYTLPFYSFTSHCQVFGDAYVFAVPGAYSEHGNRLSTILINI